MRGTFQASALALIACVALACHGGPDGAPPDRTSSTVARVTVVGPFADLEPVDARPQSANALASRVTVTAHPGSKEGGWIEVRFLCAGEPDSNPLTVKLVAYDERGLRLFDGEQETVDQRLLNRDLPPTSISTTRLAAPATHARFPASNAELGRTARVEIEFMRK